MNVLMMPIMYVVLPFFKGFGTEITNNAVTSMVLCFFPSWSHVTSARKQSFRESRNTLEKKKKESSNFLSDLTKTR